MELFDTHTHLYLPEFEADRDAVMSRAIEAGVSRMIFPNVDLSTVAPMKELHGKYPSNTFMAIGLHPTEIGETWRENLAVIRHELDSSSDYVSVGEIGIDLYWDKTFEREQMLAFSEQVSWAVDRDMPVIIHCRDGLDQVLEVLQGFNGRVKGVFHSFGGSESDVDRIRDTGDFYFGINGIVTFKNSGLRATLPHIGIERIVLETDSPYLAPVPFRGKRNESAYVSNVAATVAGVFDIDLERIGAITSSNAEKLFLKME